ncbi:hypothetical protein RZS08_62895, partial [Arthrospira platensis SPKY1]|nr:hypothetical protein [Arthrospira platensis SPKY1]
RFDQNLKELFKMILNIAFILGEIMTKHHNKSIFYAMHCNKRLNKCLSLIPYAFSRNLKTSTH